MEKKRNVYKILVGKRELKRSLGRPRSRWEDNIEVNVGEIECEYEDWIHLAQVRDRWWALVNTIMKFRVPLKAGNFFTS
jgi:hypothetical protein